MINIITIHDCEYNIIYANDDARRILGLPCFGREGVKCYDYFHGKGFMPIVCAGQKCFSRSGPSNIRIFEPHLNKFLEIKATPLYDARNEPIGMFHVAREVEPPPGPSS